MYIHEIEQWPDFSWDERRLSPLLARVRHAQGRLLGRMEALGFQTREEATLQALTQDVVKTSGPGWGRSTTEGSHAETRRRGGDGRASRDIPEGCQRVAGG